LELLKGETIKSILSNYHDKSPKEAFKVFHLIFKRDYELSSEEAKKRFVIFKDNLIEINKINSLELPYKLAINQFADLTLDEYRSKYLHRIIRTSEELQRDLPDANFLSNEEEDDLTKRNLQTTMTQSNWSKYFSGVRDQGDCSSCWTFAATGLIESCFAIKNGSPYQYLSPQQLLDCDRQQSGCNGGDTISTVQYAKTNGMMKDADYPYRAVQGTCKFSATKVVAKILGTTYCSNYRTSGSCNALIVNKMLLKGPLAVGIDGGTNGFMFYSSGVFTGSCSDDNHAVVLIGYGVDPLKGDYWLVRNSWGASWGASGYIKVKRNDSNKLSCFVTNEAVANTC
jgi:C1A family cysteine protease